MTRAQDIDSVVAHAQGRADELKACLTAYAYSGVGEPEGREHLRHWLALYLRRELTPRLRFEALAGRSEYQPKDGTRERDHVFILKAIERRLVALGTRMRGGAKRAHLGRIEMTEETARAIVERLA